MRLAVLSSAFSSSVPWWPPGSHPIPGRRGQRSPLSKPSLCLPSVSVCHTAWFCCRCFHLRLPFVLWGSTEKEGEPRLIVLHSVSIPSNRARFFLAGLFSGCHNSWVIRGPCHAPLSVLIPYFGKKIPLWSCQTQVAQHCGWLAGCSAGGGAERSPGHEVSRNAGSSPACLWGSVLLQAKIYSDLVRYIPLTSPFCSYVPRVGERERITGSNARPKWAGRASVFLSCLWQSSARRLWCKVITGGWILLMIYTDFQCLFIKKKVICSTMDVVQNIYFLFQNTQNWVHCSLLGCTTAALLSQRLRNKNKQVMWSISWLIGIRKNI